MGGGHVGVEGGGGCCVFVCVCLVGVCIKAFIKGCVRISDWRDVCVCVCMCV